MQISIYGCGEMDGGLLAIYDKVLKGLSHEIETGYKLCCWIDLS